MLGDPQKPCFRVELANHLKQHTANLTRNCCERKRHRRALTHRRLMAQPGARLLAHGRRLQVRLPRAPQQVELKASPGNLFVISFRKRLAGCLPAMALMWPWKGGEI